MICLADYLRIGFPFSLPAKDRILLTLQGYFDDSGTHDESASTVVAGYLSTAEQWEIFDQEWRSAIEPWGVDQFHMAEFANRAPKYQSLSETQRRFGFARLAKIINTHAIASVGCAIPRKAFERIFTPRAKRFVGGCYGLAATSCFMQAAELLNQHGYESARISYAFESGTAGSGAVLKVFNSNCNDPEQRERLKLLSLSFEGKEFTPLQAADMLAYELYRFLPYRINEPATRPPRRGNMSLLAECALRSWATLEEDAIEGWAKVADVAANYHGTGKMKRR